MVSLNEKRITRQIEDKRHKTQKLGKHVVSLVHKKRNFDSNMHCPKSNHANLWINLRIVGGHSSN